jgi:ABC-type multidrug transport system fused ATPase/permease subunit
MLQRTFDYVDLRGDVELRPTAGLERARDPVSLVAGNVSFAYPRQDHPAVRDVSLELAPKSYTLVVGGTGGGKSTLALLLAGQLRPACGEIRIDGIAMAPEDLWEYVTLIPQETVLFNSSLRENLLFAAPDTTDDELERVIERVGLSEFVEELHLGLDSAVGAQGYALSGGERQRLGLARALLDDAPILVADEPTSAVDNATATRLQEVLLDEARHRTVVVIAHRVPSLPVDCEVVVMQRGRVVARGCHGELLSAEGPYADLVALQAARGTTASGHAP